MKTLKTFETWNDNIIDNSLFVSGRAKYDPKVSNGVIDYETGTSTPYYFAEITKKGGKFICKIYKKKKNGEEVRLRNKIKKTLKTAHNYVREYLNQRLKKKDKKKEKKSEVQEIVRREEPQFEPMMATMLPIIEPPKSKTIIRKFY